MTAGSLSPSSLPTPPTVDGVNPEKGSRRQQGEIITITGTNFLNVQDVSFGSGITVDSFTVKNNTTIKANIGIAPDAALGARDVLVTTKAGSTGTLTGRFTVLPPFPRRADDDYDQGIRDFSVKQEDLAALPDDERQDAIKDELTTCDKLVSEWGECCQVVQDCKELIESAHDDVASGDLVAGHKKLWKVRQRLVQAWHSIQDKKNKKCWICGYLAYLIVALFGCVSVLVWLHLLPGEDPRVAVGNVNLAALYSSFLFGAIGGIFDALSAFSKNYTEETLDLDHWFWYVCSPFLGAILGAVVFAVFLAGLLGTTGSGLRGNTTVEVPQNLWGNLTQDQLNALVNAASNTAEPSVRAALILVLAFIAGFKQITVTNFLERLAKSIFGGSNG